MPGVGKSTVGVLLAKAMRRAFLDCDLLVQERERQPLQTLLAEMGAEAFCRMEEEHILSLRCENTVIATGGSAVYGERAMNRLREMGEVLYLELSLAALERRLTNLSVRGVVMEEGQALSSLHRERDPLYRRYAHEVIATEGLDQDQVVAAVLRLTR